MKLLAWLAALAALPPVASALSADGPFGGPRSAAASDAHSTQTAPPVRAAAAHPFARALRKRRAVVWAVGDGADGKQPAKALARRIARGRPDRFLYLGDVYEHGTYKEFREHYHPVYGRFAKKTSATPGNHDWPRHRTGYDRYWKRITGRRPPRYYEFSLAGWQILSLNSEGPHEPGSAQVRWLERQVRSPGTCRLAFWHTPRYSAGTVHRDQAHIAPLWDALRGRAALVVNGHEHNLQRLKAIDGITELIAGAGGHRHYPVNHDDPRLAFADDRHYGALRLVLRPGRAGFAFIDRRGRRLDSGRVSCEKG
jgi:predicted phosphodiesterase